MPDQKNLLIPPVVILIRPQMGENIGAVARAMSNFGLSELRIVAPRDGWPNDKATEMAAGGEEIIAGAKIYANVADALHGIQRAYATTARPRDMAKPVAAPQEAVHEIRHSGAASALVFGPERTGIENDELTLCDVIVTIPTSEKNRSLNLAQSMVILGYEWAKAAATPAPKNTADIAPKEDMVGLFEQLENYLDAAEYFRVAHKKPVMLQNIKTMLLRGNWSAQEVRTLRGMLRSLWERSS